MSGPDANAERPAGSVAGLALREAWRRPVAWGFSAAGLFALAMTVVPPVHRWFTDTLGTRYAAGSQRYSLTEVFRQDHAAELDVLWSAVASAAGWLALIALLFGVFTAGGWLGTLVEGPPRPMRRRFFGGAARYFWRFLRVAVLTLLALALVDWLLLGASWREHVLEGHLGWPGGNSEHATSEQTVWQWGVVQAGLHFLAFQFVLVIALLARTRLALQNGRSALLASLASLWLVVRHPVRTLRPLIAIFLIEWALLLGLGLLVGWVQAGLEDGGSLARVWISGLLVIAALVLREVLRGARYVAAFEASRGLVRAPEHPDPWASRVGPPGGPQYPIGDEDEFSISL